MENLEPKKKLFKCAGCGAERELTEKPEPKTPKETKQINFICKKCGAWNLRDGTAKLQKDAGSAVSTDKIRVSDKTPNGIAPEPALIPEKSAKVRKKRGRPLKKKEIIEHEKEPGDPFIPWL